MKRNVFEVPTGSTGTFIPPTSRAECDCCGDDGDDGTGPDNDGH